MKLLLLSILALIATVASSPPPLVAANLEVDGLEALQGYIGEACTNTQQDNLRGTCQYTSTCKSRDGRADTNPDCPGPDNVQCCVYDKCVNGATGRCLDKDKWNCQGGGGFNTGNHCPGPDWYLCCQGEYWKRGTKRPLFE